MDRQPSRRRFDQAAVAGLAALILGGCTLFGEKPEIKADPVETVCSIPYPPTLTREEARQTPPRLGRWTSGAKRALEQNGCPVSR